MLAAVEPSVKPRPAPANEAPKPEPDQPSPGVGGASAMSAPCKEEASAPLGQARATQRPSVESEGREDLPPSTAEGCAGAGGVNAEELEPERNAPASVEPVASTAPTERPTPARLEIPAVPEPEDNDSPEAVSVPSVTIPERDESLDPYPPRPPSRSERTRNAPSRRPEPEGPRQPDEPRRTPGQRDPSGAASHRSKARGYSRPELLCRRTGDIDEWEVVLSVDPEMNVTEVRCGDVRLADQDGEYRLPRFSGKLALEWGDGESGEIPLFEEKTPLLFRLTGTEDSLRGHQCRQITNGRFLAIAPADWLREDGEYRERNRCSDPGFGAHFYKVAKDDPPESLGSLGPWNLGADRSAMLAGGSVVDSSDDGELFVGDPPEVESRSGLKWARVGEERRGGWQGQNFRVEEESIARVLDQRQGRFFLRTYAPGSIALADSTVFRYWSDLKEIEVNGEPFREDLVLLPARGQRDHDSVRLIGRHGLLTPDECGAHAEIVDGAVRVASTPEADNVRLLLREGPSEMHIVVSLPRVWWRLSGKTDWTNQPVRLTRAEFRRAGAALEVLGPTAAKQVSAGLDGEHQPFQAGWDENLRNKRRCIIPLDEFRDHRAVTEDVGTGFALRLRLLDCELTAVHLTPDDPPPAVRASTEPGRLQDDRTQTRHSAGITQGRNRDIAAPWVERGHLGRHTRPKTGDRTQNRPAAQSRFAAGPSGARNAQMERTGDPDLKDKVVSINRVTKVVKGGKNLSFSALVVVGNEDGRVGFGLGKAREVPAAIKKGIEIAKKNIKAVPREGATIAHQVVGKFGAARVLLKPASPGTGVIAGGPVRAVIELAGIKNILTKSIGSTNPKNVVEATISGLLSLRSAREVAELRGKDARELGFEGGRAHARSK